MLNPRNSIHFGFGPKSAQPQAMVSVLGNVQIFNEPWLWGSCYVSIGLGRLWQISFAMGCPWQGVCPPQ